MTRLKLTLGILAVAGIAIGLIAFQPSQSILGQISGDEFCSGYPTRYWSQQFLAGPASRSEALAALEKAGAESVGVLRELLRSHSDPEIRWTAAELLGRLGPSAHEAGPDLVAGTSDSDPHVRTLSAVSIPKVEVPAEQALTVLIPMLESDQAGVIARAISVYRGQAKSALPALVKLLEDENRDTEARWNAARALGKLGPEGIDSLPVLIKFSRHAEETIREHSAEAIGDIGPTAVAGIPVLIDCLEDAVAKVRRDAVRSLGYMGPVAKDAVPKIQGLLKDPESIVREAALNALKAIAPESVPAPMPESATPPAEGAAPPSKT